MKTKIKLFGMSVIAITTLGIIGCGSGGGSSSSENSSGLSFPSNAVSAEPTLENGKQVKDATATNHTEGIPTLNSVENESKLNIALLSSEVSKRLFLHLKDINSELYSLNETVNETQYCSGGGTLSYSGSGDDINGGHVTYTFSNCSDGHIKMNGSIYMTIKNRDAEIDNFRDLSAKYVTDFTITNVSNNYYAKIYSNSHEDIKIITFDSSGDPKEFKADMSIIGTDSIKKFGLQNCRFYFSRNENELSWYQTEGKVYIDNLTSYVNYDTSYDMSQTPFVFTNYNNTLISGEERYNMSGGGKVKIVVEANEAKTYVDVDGDGTYELSE